MPRKSESRASQEEVTRCLCGHDVFVATARTRALNANPGLFVQCERCHVWQHGFCMGFASEEQVPDSYYCEQCEPAFHRLLHRNGVPTSRYRPHAGALAESRADDREGAPRDASDAPEPMTRDPDDALRRDERAAGPKLDAKDARPDSRPDSRPDQRRDAKKDAKVDAKHDAKPDTKAETKADAGADSAVDLKSDAKPDAKSEAKPRARTGSRDARPADAEPKEEERKRRRSSDPEFTRNRRRFRESEILQMVLEESAREAEEAARRAAAQADAGEGAEAANAANAANAAAEQPQAASRRVSDAAEPAHDEPAPDAANETAAELETETNDEGEPEDARKRRAADEPDAKRRARPARRGARRGAKPRAPREPPGTPRRSKPRLPSARTSLGEMIRRVATVLDFSSRAQSELAAESASDFKLMRAEQLSPDLRARVNDLEQVYKRNIAGLEQLTQRLLEWDETYNK